MTNESVHVELRSEVVNAAQMFLTWLVFTVVQSQLSEDL